MAPPIYVLGTGLSHNGSAVLLKNGKICVAIEKERLSRVKHDGGNDTLAIQYCLDAENIKLSDIALIVQCANFDIPKTTHYKGKRVFAESDASKIITISHHLAHAYSAVGTSPFSECAVMVIDGCGSPLNQFLELHPKQKEFIPSSVVENNGMQCEKDSFYHFDGQTLKPLWKDFSPMADQTQDKFALPTTQHSIGGFYATISHYVFGDMQDVGKLMGLAPFGTSGIYNVDAFEFDGPSLLVKEDWKNYFSNPSKGYGHFKENFTYYANVAKWAQEQVEKAVLKCMQLRLEAFPHLNVCYTGGVALNAVANSKLLEKNIVKNLYIEPAAADNGLALGCAYYGWIEYLKKPKTMHNGNTCFGKQYDQNEIDLALSDEVKDSFTIQKFEFEDKLLTHIAEQLKEGKTVGWFHSGSEFGPRALGRRSILAHPGKENLKDFINLNIKFREDFRPFAPAVLSKMAPDYFESGRNSPYMILIDKTRSQYINQLKNITHYDGTARLQTVDGLWNSRFTKLLIEFKKQSGIPVLLNTSLNRKGTPMVETPEDAIQLFKETALEILVLENTVLEKKSNSKKQITNKFQIKTLTA